MSDGHLSQEEIDALLDSIEHPEKYPVGRRNGMKSAIIVLSFSVVLALGIGWLFGNAHGKSFDYRRGINDAEEHYKHKEIVLWDKIHQLQQSPDKCLSCGGDME